MIFAIPQRVSVREVKGKKKKVKRYLLGIFAEEAEKKKNENGCLLACSLASSSCSLAGALDFRVKKRDIKKRIFSLLSLPLFLFLPLSPALSL